MDNTTQFYNVPSAMEPLFPTDSKGELEALSIKLIELSSKLSSSIHETTRIAIADFLRPMNSYYSNLIEGHDTHPIDIERALKGDYSKDKKKRDHQQEAKAHIEVHKFISTKAKKDNVDPYSITFLKEIHKKFYEHLPANFRTVVSEEGTKKKVLPGKFRKDEVKVAKHIAPSHEHLASFMERFEIFYDPSSHSNRKKIKRIISIAASHHRLAWIHPFLDGNGRVVRLFSDASFMREHLDASGLWSISRGLARKNDDYKSYLAMADMGRQGDHDGRGNLSNKSLVAFCKFFLEVSIDQVEYMTTILDTDNIIERIEALTDLLVIKKGIKPASKHILTTMFLRGKISKADAMRLSNTSDKTSKIITDKLETLGLLFTQREKGKKAYYLPKYPINFSPSIFPGLYPSSKEVDLLKIM